MHQNMQLTYSDKNIFWGGRGQVPPFLVRQPGMSLHLWNYECTPAAEILATFM